MFHNVEEDETFTASQSQKLMQKYHCLNLPGGGGDAMHWSQQMLL